VCTEDETNGLSTHVHTIRKLCIATLKYGEAKRRVTDVEF
jgi:hypothetical protein